MNNTTQIDISKGYKQTKIGMIPEDWEVDRLENILEFKNGVNASKEDYGTGVKFINVLEIITNDYLYNEIIPGSVSISDKQYENYKVKRGDILFNRTSETENEIALAAVYLDNGPSVFGGFVIRGRFKKNIYSNQFKKYLFQNENIRKQVISKGQGAVRVNIGQGDLSKVYVPVLEKEEQKRIAACLATWDKGIEKLSALIEAKKQQKKGVMQQLLTGTLRVASASGEKFAGEWKEVKLGDLFDERNEKGFNDLELLSVGEEGVYPQSESNKKDTSNSDKSKYKLIEIGDLGYNTMRLWQGRIALSSLRGIVSPAYTIVIPKKDKANSKFFAYFFKIPFVVNKFYRNSQGMVSDTLQCRYSDFKKIKLNVPEIEEQETIVEILNKADKEIELLEKKLEAMQTQKKGLMQMLLTGQKRLIN